MPFVTAQAAKNDLIDYIVYPITTGYSHCDKQMSEPLVLVSFSYQQGDREETVERLEHLQPEDWRTGLLNAIASNALSVGEHLLQSLLKDVERAVDYLDGVAAGKPITKYTLEGIQMHKCVGRRRTTTTFSYDFEDRKGLTRVLPMSESLQQKLIRGRVPTESDIALDAVCKLHEYDLIEDCTRSIEVGEVIMQALANLTSPNTEASQ